MTYKPEYQDELVKQFRDIRSDLKHVEIALWANDYELAQSFLQELEKNHEVFLTRVAILRENLLKVRKDIEDNPRQSLLSIEGAKKWQNESMKEYFIEEKQSDLIEGQQLEHELIPLQYQIQRYKRKIEEVLQPNVATAIPSDLAKYQSKIVGGSNGQVKYHLYRFAGQINISPQQFIQRLGSELEAKPQVISEQGIDLANEWNFPLWLRVFSKDFFIEFTIFDYYRAEIIITTFSSELSKELVDKLLVVLKEI